MGRAALGLLVVAHGLVTIGIWSPAPDDEAPLRTSRSWLLERPGGSRWPWRSRPDSTSWRAARAVVPVGLGMGAVQRRDVV